MVHPAPRITTAPTPKSPNMENNCAGGICACAAARVILHATNVSVCVVRVWEGETTGPVEEPGTYWFVETGEVCVRFCACGEGGDDSGC
jgi:hypothetical protein